MSEEQFSNLDEEQNSVTILLAELRNADQVAAAELWNRFFDRLRLTAIRKLSPETRRVYDEEDAAISAFNSFCKGIEVGRYPDLRNRDELLALLFVITGRKVMRRHRFDRQQKRDTGRNVTEAMFHGVNHSLSAGGGIEQLEGIEPTPEFAASFTETCDRFFENLGDDQLQKIASMRMEGYQDKEIAQELNCARSTVQRRLEIIRRECKSLLDVQN